MDIGRILNTNLDGSHPSEASADNSASNPRPVAEIASASTPSINVHTTTAMTDGPVPELDAIAEGELPWPGFDAMYDDERRPPPEVNAGPDNGLPTLPPIKKSNGRSDPPKVKPTPRIISSANSHRTDTSPAAPIPVIIVNGTTVATSSDTRRPILPNVQSESPLASRPIDTTTSASSSGINIHWTASTTSRGWPREPAPLPGRTSPLTSRRPDPAARSSNSIPDVAEIIDVDATVTRPNAAARSSNSIPDVAEIIDVDATVTRPNAAARSSNRIPDVAEILNVDATVTRPNATARSTNRIPDVAEILDVDAWEARRRMQGALSLLDLSVQVGSSALVSPVQASSRTLSESELEQNVVAFLASSSSIRDISQEHSGSSRGNNGESGDGDSFSLSQTEPWYNLNIEWARQNDYDRELGGALLWDIANKCRKSDEIQCESCDEECESCDEAAANTEYIYVPRTRQQTRNGNALQTIRAHPGNAVWALVGSRNGPVNDPRKWERACARCSPYTEEQREEQREQTIPLEEAAVDDKENGMTGAATYNPDLYTTTSSMRELRVKLPPPKGEPKDMASSPNPSSPPPPDQAPSSSSSSNAKGKQKANGDDHSNQSQPTPRLASARATRSRPIVRGTREANANVNSNASGTQAHSPPPPPPRSRSRSPTRTSLRNRLLFSLEPQLPPLLSAPVVASSSIRSQRYVSSPLGQAVARTTGLVQTFSNNKTKEADNEDDNEQVKRGGKNEKKNVSRDGKGNVKANNKRKASEAVEDADADIVRVTRARRTIVSNSSNGYYMSGALQDSQNSAASGTLAAGSGTGTNHTVPSGLAAHTPDPAMRSTPTTTAPRSEGSSERRVRLRLRVSAEANPEHPDHMTYLMARGMSRKGDKE